ncbi:MAG: thioredoxin [Bacteroidales bacterium]|nr:thioredoxin [Bacteroidales bacterium]
MATIHLTKETFIEKVYDFSKNPGSLQFKGNRPAVIDFYAQWCGPCKMMSPVMEELSEQYEGKVDIYKIDVDQESDLAAMFNVRSIPTFVFIPMNGTIKISMGATSKEDFSKKIQTNLLNQ